MIFFVKLHVLPAEYRMITGQSLTYPHSKSRSEECTAG